jgi:hypothetical protein
MAYGAFGDIRALLHGAPSKGTWEKLCAEVRLWREPELSQLVLPYVLAQLERWPDALRVVRPDWSKDLLRGRARGAHFVAMARDLIVEDTSPTREQWDNLSALDWRSLRHMRLDRVSIRAPRRDDPLEWLGRHGLLARLDALTLDVTSAHSLRGAIERGDLSHLRALSIHRVHLTFNELFAMAVADWPNLESLSLSGSWLRTRSRGRAGASIEPLHEDVFAPRLTHLDLAGTTYGRSALHDLRKAEWLPSLTYLSLNARQSDQTSPRLYDSALIGLLQHGDLTALTHLRLDGNADRRHAEALSKNPTAALERIEVLGEGHYSDLVDFAYGVLSSDTFSEAAKAPWRGYTAFD